MKILTIALLSMLMACAVSDRSPISPDSEVETHSLVILGIGHAPSSDDERALSQQASQLTTDMLGTGSARATPNDAGCTHAGSGQLCCSIIDQGCTRGSCCCTVGEGCDCTTWQIPGCGGNPRVPQ